MATNCQAQKRTKTSPCRQFYSVASRDSIGWKSQVYGSYQMIEPILKSKFLGALVGTAVGDALGAGFEGRHKVKPEETEEVARARKVLVYTDDTHMMKLYAGCTKNAS